MSEFDAASISTIHGFATQVRRTLGPTSAIDPDARLTRSRRPGRRACADALAAASAGDRSTPEDFPKLAIVVGHQVAHGRSRPAPGAGRLRSRRWPPLRAGPRAGRGRGRPPRRPPRGRGHHRFRRRPAPAARAPGGRRRRLPWPTRCRSATRWCSSTSSRTPTGSSGTSSPRCSARPGSDGTLVLVGDPKQAIYRFRGADIAVYLDAVGGDPDAGGSPSTPNWRADGACSAPCGRCSRGPRSVMPGSATSTVEPRRANRDRRMVDATGASLSGLHVRAAVGAGPPRNDTGNPDMDAVGDMIRLDLVAHVRGLLDGSQIPTSQKDPTLRDLRPSDIAVLVTRVERRPRRPGGARPPGGPRRGRRGGKCPPSEAADQVALPPARHGAPGRPAPGAGLRAVVVRTLDRRAGGDELTTRTWPDSRIGSPPGPCTLAERSVAEVLAEVWSESGVVAHVLGTTDGDRNVDRSRPPRRAPPRRLPQGRSGVAGLVHLLDHPPEAEADADTDGDVTARRIESEAEAVQIMTDLEGQGPGVPGRLPARGCGGRHETATPWSTPTRSPASGRST